MLQIPQAQSAVGRAGSARTAMLAFAVTAAAVACSSGNTGPPPVTDLVAVPRSRAATLSWTARGAGPYSIYVSPAATCDNPHNITFCPDGRIIQSATSPATVTGLSNGEPYYFQVAGVGVAATADNLSNLASARPNRVVVEGSVAALATDADGTVYLGGAFAQLGTFAGLAVPLDAQSGRLASATYPLIDGPAPSGSATNIAGSSVNVVVADGGGGWYLAGSFSQVAGRTLFPGEYGLIHVLADGSVDARFNAVPDGFVQALAISGNVLYVAGFFTTIGGSTRNTLAAVDATTGAVLAWAPSPLYTNPLSPRGITALAVSGDTVYIGGFFTSIDGIARNGLAALDATSGAVLPWNPAPDYGVETLALSGSTLYVVGDFSTIGGASRSGAAAVDALSGAVLPWNPDALRSSINALVTAGSVVYLGGSFATIGGAARQGLAAVDAATGALLPWNPGTTAGPLACCGYVYALALAGNTLYVGGWFAAIGGVPRNDLAAVDASSGEVLPWNPNPDGIPFALAVAGSTVYAGGGFTAVGPSLTRNGLAALDESGNPTTWNPDVEGTVQALALEGTRLYIGGSFTAVGGQPRSSLAALDTGTGSVLPWTASLAGGLFGTSVATLALGAGAVYVGGSFTTVDGVSRTSLAALEPSSGELLAWNPVLNPTPGNIAAGIFPCLAISGLAVTGDAVWASGCFLTTGATPYNSFAAFDADTGAVLTRKVSLENPPTTLVAVGDTLYVSGYGYLAALDATTGRPSWQAALRGSAAALLPVGATLYAAGAFDQVDGSARAEVAALDAASGNLLPWNPQLWAGCDCLSPTSLAVSGSTIYVGTPNAYVIDNGLLAIDIASGMPWPPGAAATIP